MSRGLLVALAALVASGPAAAQFGESADPCPLGEAQGWLRGVEVEAALFTNGNLFFGNETTSGYLVPKASRRSPVYAANLWVGGLVEGDVRTASGRYSAFQFRPGLTGPDRTPPTPAECAAADRIWTVARSDVEAFLAGAPPTADLAEWPVDLGAPVLDGDGVEGNYDLAAGDQPAIRGDVTAFWAMTDTAAERWAEDEAPLGLDVAVEAFAFREARFGRATTYRFTVTNRNAVAVDSAYAGLFLDPDLGSGGDDYIGTDTTAHMAFVYNASDTDAVYGVPPAFGVVVAEGPAGLLYGRDADGAVGESGVRLGLAASKSFENVSGGALAFPARSEGVYYVLRGLWGDGTPVRAWGSGYAPQMSAPITPFAFPGDPVTEAFWSEVNNDGSGADNGVGNRYVTVSTGPFRLAPDSSTTVTFVLVFAQGADRFDSIVRLRGQARGVLAATASGAFDPVRIDGPLPEVPLSVRRPHPNPFREAAVVEVAGHGTEVGVAVLVSVYDVLGRRMSGPTAVASSEGRVEVGRGLVPGVYLVRVEGGGFAESFAITKVR